MRRAQAHNEESRLEAEKGIKYKGTARIRLKWLHFRWNEPGELDVTNVERLKSIFRKECCRLDMRNHICAVIDQQHLDAAILISGISAEALLTKPENGYPELVFPAGYQLECLHGRHRIQAGKEVLPPADKWWTVDLYLADIDRGLKTYLIEEYSNEGKPADGVIYRKIRQYHFQRNLSFERRWWNRLTAHGKRCLRQLFRHDELTAACDALLDITGLWGGWRNSTLHTMMAMKCHEEILCYLHHIKEVWETLLQRDRNAMQKVDQVTVKALELKAPRVSTLDAKALRGQVLGGDIFGAFSEQERVAIWRRLQAVDGLIPSLFTFFEDVKYLEACANCMKRLISLSPRDTVFTALEKAFCDANGRADRAVIQLAESSFTSSPASLADRVDLGYRQLHAYAMRHYLQMPREPKGKELLARLMINTDETVLRDFADLADRLGFESPEIIALKQCPKSTVARARSERSKPLLATDGAGEIKKRRCGLPRVEDYVEDGEFLFVNHLHNDEEEQGEGITSFFVRKSVYFAFFGRPLPLTLDSIPRVSDRIEEDMNRSQDVRITHERPEQEYERQEHERQELERLEQERLKSLEQERQEQERQELERQEQERLEQERLKSLEQKRQEQERLEQERLEQERLKSLEQERQEQERQEQERLNKERLKRESLREKQKMTEQERLKKERLEKEEQERKKKEERERQEQEERERQEQEERERQEREERREREKEEQEQQEREEQEKQERLEYQSLEDQQRLQDQQRLEQEELLEEGELDQEEKDQQTEQDVNRGETLAKLVSTEKVRKPETQLETRLDNTKVRINFKFREGGFWKDASFLIVDPFDPSEVERAAKKKIREKIRLFDTELRMLTPQECYQAVIADGTYTILLIRESEIDIDDELQISTMDLRINVLSQQQRVLKRVAINDISELHHVRKKHTGRVFI